MLEQALASDEDLFSGLVEQPKTCDVHCSDNVLTAISVDLRKESDLSKPADIDVTCDNKDNSIPDKNSIVASYTECVSG